MIGGHDAKSGVGAGRRGKAGHLLTIADLQIRGFEAADWEGLHTDVIAEVGGVFRRFQVKAKRDVTPSLTFGQTPAAHSLRAGNRSHNGVRTLCSYIGKIDAFAFVLLPRRLVFYVSIDAIGTDQETMTISERNFTRQGCDMTYEDLMCRWNLAERVVKPVTAIDSDWKQPSLWPVAV